MRVGRAVFACSQTWISLFSNLQEQTRPTALKTKLRVGSMDKIRQDHRHPNMAPWCLSVARRLREASEYVHV